VCESFAPGEGGAARVRVRRTARRSLSMRGRLAAPKSDPAALPLRFALVSGGEVLLEHTAPAGAFRRLGRRWVLQSTPGSAAPRLVTLSLKPRPDGAFGFRARATLLALPAPLRALRVEVTLGDLRECASAR
jgi:hypothetical protein